MAFIVWFYRSSIYIATKTLLKKTAKSFPRNNCDDTVRHVRARCHFHKALQLKREISLIIASCVIMAISSFASLVERVVQVQKIQM